MARAGLCPRILTSIPTQMLSNRSAFWETSLPETLRTMYSALGEGVVPVIRAHSCHPLLSRACPGRHFAAASLFIHCASVLHVFDIMPPKDANGNPVVMKYRPNDDIVS